MRLSRLPIATVTVSVLLLAPSACGGEREEPKTSASEGISKEEFLTSANAICKAGSAEIDALGESLGETPTPAQVTAMMTQAMDNVAAQIDDIEALGLPEDDEAELTALFAEARTLVEQVKADPEAALNAGDPFADVNAELHAYGLHECAD